MVTVINYKKMFNEILADSPYFLSIDFSYYCNSSYPIYYLESVEDELEKALGKVISSFVDLRMRKIAK